MGNVRTRAKGARKHYADPYGERSTSRNITAVLGPKPNWATWQQYHAIAQTAPWKLTQHAADHAPLATPRPSLLVAPNRRLTDKDRAAIRAAHDQLRAGAFGEFEYFTALHAVDAGLVPYWGAA